MTRISRRPVRKELEERMFALLMQSFRDLNNEKDVFNFIEDLLSPTEKIMIAKRLAIAILLEKGWNSREISFTLKVSTATVNSVRIKISFLGKGYKQAVKTILQKEEVASFFEKLAETVVSVLYPVKNRGLSSSPRDLISSYRKTQTNKRDDL